MENIYKASRMIGWVVFLSVSLFLFSSSMVVANIDAMEKVTEKIETDLKKFGEVISTADGHLVFKKKYPTASDFSGLIANHLTQYPSVSVSGYMVIRVEKSNEQSASALLKKAGVSVKQTADTLRLTIDNLQSLKQVSKSLLGQGYEVVSIDLQFDPVEDEA